MSAGMGKCSKIRYIVRLRQMLRRWRNKAAASSAQRRLPSDVPPGHVAICVGPNYKRYIVRATLLNHPLFQKLLAQAEEEFGFSHSGPLCIPCCDESLFEDILRFMTRSDSTRFVNLEDFQTQRSYCHLAFCNRPDSRPLLEKSVWS